MRRFLISCVLTIALAASTSGRTYTIVDLGTLGGGESGAFGLNAWGQVVGRSATQSGEVHGFVYYDGTMADIGVLPGHVFSQAYDINNFGVVVGQSSADEASNLNSRAFVYHDDVLSGIPTPGFAYATAVNDVGTIVGHAVDVHGIGHAFAYMSGSLADLGAADDPNYDYSTAWGINSSGDVVGYSTVLCGGCAEAFLYTDEALSPLPSLGSPLTRALGINDGLQVTGSSLIENQSAEHAFLYSDGTMLDLGTLDGTQSFGLSINNKGDVVGTLAYLPSQSNRGFLYRDGVMVDVNSLMPADSEWEILADAQDINDIGQIVGYGVIRGERHAYLLSPIRLSGDTNDNGIVDLADLNAVRNSFGTQGLPGIPGDAAPFDGQVDIDDLNLVRNQFGQRLDGRPVTVPEPTTIVLALFSTAFLWALGFHRRMHLNSTLHCRVFGQSRWML